MGVIEVKWAENVLADAGRALWSNPRVPTQ